MTADLSPEERARAIIPMHYRAETAATSVMPSMDMVLSSRCTGALRDAIASAIRQAVAAERERCAKVAEERPIDRGDPGWEGGQRSAAEDIAAAIRSLKETDNA